MIRNIQRFQIYGLLTIAGLLAVAVALALHSAWHHLGQLRKDFRASQSEGFHLAEHVQARMPLLNEAIFDSGATNNSAALAAFLEAGEAMKGWIRSNKLSVTSTEQADLLSQMQAALDIYVKRTVAFAQASKRNSPQPLPEEVNVEATHILKLAGELRVAEQGSLRRFMERSNLTLASLQAHLAGTVILTFVLGLAVAKLIHLAKIAPLSAELAKTRTAFEQHEKLASLGTLAAGVAHEIRNPLTAIKVRLHGLNRSMVEESEREDAAVIDQEIQRLERIVRDFLQFARPSAPQVETIPATRLFEQVRKLLGPQLESAGVDLRVDCPAEIQVCCDPQQIEQVLINLIQNAVESLEDSGLITLRASTEVPAPANRPPGVVLEVADTGKGISPEIESRLFDPFFSTKEDGTGLGLSIAARIVERHGGLLQYKTQLGQGTTFSIILPRPEKDIHDDQTQSPPGRG